MGQIDYAALDAEESKANSSAAIEQLEQPEELEQMEQPQRPRATSAAKPKRKAPMTDEQRLEAAQKSVATLQAKVVANRDRLRRELIEDLYRKYSISEVTGDPSEHHRLSSLRAKLGL